VGEKIDAKNQFDGCTHLLKPHFNIGMIVRQQESIEYSCKWLRKRILEKALMNEWQ